MRSPSSHAPNVFCPIRLSVGLLILSLCQNASADTETRWSVPADCGTRAQFEQALRERIGAEADTLLADTTVSIESTKDRYTMTVRMGRQERTLSDQNCQDLFRAGVVVALAFHNAPENPKRASDPAVPPSAPPQNPPVELPPSSPPVKPLTPVIASPKPILHKPKGSAFLLGAELGLTNGLVPELRTFLSPFVAFETPRFGVELSARYIPKSEKKDDQGKGVSVYALGSTLSVYYKPDPVFGVQGGLFAYRLTGRGIGSEANSTSNIVALGPHIGLWVTPLESSRFFLRASAEAQFNFLRSRFEILEYNDVFRSSRVIFQGGAKAGCKF